jgi:hypothetical protein
MNRLLLTAVILAAPSLALSQTDSPSMATLRQSSVRVDSIPLSDTIVAEKLSAPEGSSKAGPHNRGRDSVGEKDDSQSRFWGSAEYLLWRMKGSDLPPLITVGPGTIGSRQAIIGQPGTIIVLGGERLYLGKFPGGRFTAGMWLNKKRDLGVEVSYFFLKERTFKFQVSSNGQAGSQVIARPYFNILTNAEASLTAGGPLYLDAIPPLFDVGSITATLPSQLQGAGANLAYRLAKINCCRITLLAGFRYLDLNEGLTMMDVEDVNRTHRTDMDQFFTRNRFYGGQVGARSAFRQGHLSLELSGSVALGSNRESVEINGATFHSLNLPHDRVGAILAAASNIGRYSRSKFTVIPETSVNLGYDLGRTLRASVGYDFFFWNRVVRPGDQIDRVVNPLMAPALSGVFLQGPLRPAFSFNDKWFWAQGLRLGIQTRF